MFGGNPFLSTPSGWRATGIGCRQTPTHQISIHALRVEGDRGFKIRQVGHDRFLSTPSGWRATKIPAHLQCPARFLSTPSGWRATKRSRRGWPDLIFLSTPSGWRATVFGICPHLSNFISIHALRVEGDGAGTKLDYQRDVFLSTPSGWRATTGRCLRRRRSEFLSTPSGWRATRIAYCRAGPGAYISIHALRVEGDSKNRQSFRLFLRKREKNLPL